MSSLVKPFAKSIASLCLTLVKMEKIMSSYCLDEKAGYRLQFDRLIRACAFEEMLQQFNCCGIGVASIVKSCRCCPRQFAKFLALNLRISSVSSEGYCAYLRKILMLASLACFGFVGGVIAGTQQMQRDIRLVAHNPAIVPGRDVEDVTGLHFDDTTIIHGGGGTTRDY